MKSTSKEENTREKDGVSIRKALEKDKDTTSSSTISSTSWALSNHEKQEPKEASAKYSAKEINGNCLNDPISFWASWSERQANCEKNEHGTQTTCNCFEGMGSVM
jgi:hypothetical protein